MSQRREKEGSDCATGCSIEGWRPVPALASLSQVSKPLKAGLAAEPLEFCCAALSKSGLRGCHVALNCALGSLLDPLDKPFAQSKALAAPCLATTVMAD
jgi:hypothetical protein